MSLLKAVFTLSLLWLLWLFPHLKQTGALQLVCNCPCTMVTFQLAKPLWLPSLLWEMFWSHHLFLLLRTAVLSFYRVRPIRVRPVWARKLTVITDRFGPIVTHAIRFQWVAILQPRPLVSYTELSSPPLPQLWLDPGLWCSAAHPGRERALCWRS